MGVIRLTVTMATTATSTGTELVWLVMLFRDGLGS